jgi:hypothetical protein
VAGPGQKLRKQPHAKESGPGSQHPCCTASGAYRTARAADPYTLRTSRPPAFLLDWWARAEWCPGKDWIATVEKLLFRRVCVPSGVGLCTGNVYRIFDRKASLASELDPPPSPSSIRSSESEAPASVAMRTPIPILQACRLLRTEPRRRPTPQPLDFVVPSCQANPLDPHPKCPAALHPRLTTARTLLLRARPRRTKSAKQVRRSRF